jgi:hypothetical protein
MHAANDGLRLVSASWRGGTSWQQAIELSIDLACHRKPVALALYFAAQNCQFFGGKQPR